ncbi:phage holin family protein [Pseudomonas viridiflava]|uniref:phage holin family protein n=1 Tax=Pseudomonas viridiflava TaxID=33069 RepID=UPI000F0604F9|nr:phage holin family protein [Pseudomonas viridiflava]
MSTTPNTPPEGDTSALGLIRQLAHEVPALLSKELALAKAEVRESIQAAKAGVAAVGGGAVVMFAGLVIVLLAAVYALANIMQPWLAALIVGVVAMVIGFIMIQSGKKQFDASNMTPERTVSSLQKDKDAIQRKVS